jgi:hypothetical protein
MFCANNKNMCSGCINESMRHQKVAKIEQDILTNNATNETWAMILPHITLAIDLKNVCKLLQHLPTLNTYRRGDHIFGAS